MSRHGTRGNYAGGCRCAACRLANTQYQRERRLRLEPGFVDAAETRLHLLALSMSGIGRRAVADACDLDQRTVWLIRTGRRERIHATTAAKILAVDADARADHSRISAKATHGRIRALVGEGYTKLFLARQLNYRGTGLPFRARTITARNALRVERLARSIQAGRVSR